MSKQTDNKGTIPQGKRTKMKKMAGKETNDYPVVKTNGTDKKCQ